MDHNSYKKFSNLFQKNKYKGYFQSENSEFDKIISDASGLTQRAIDSEKVFKYALDCEYRIKI